MEGSASEARRRRPPFGSSDRRTIATCALVLVVLALGAFWAARSLHSQEQLKVFARDGWCPRGTSQQERAGLIVPGHTAVLIDTSNRISSRDVEGAFGAIDRVLRDTARTPYLQRISVYGLPETEHERAEAPQSSLCVPLQGYMADRLYQNPRVVNLDFRDFVGVVKVKLDSLLAREEASSSPIVETMSYLARGDDDLTSFIVVSDMLQNTSRCDLYSGECEMRSLCAPLRESNVDFVYVYYIDRGIPMQSSAWPDRDWNECLGSIAGTVLN